MDKLIIGCNYHTSWQSNKAMRFVLAEIDGDRARLTTRTTGKSFWTKTKDLIFIPSKHNKNKAKEIRRKSIVPYTCEITQKDLDIAAYLRSDVMPY